ncbi:putative diguanylate cyclase YcdT [Pseudomonas citronellolis]|nr:putative diguanylate cyclase YcdT [Pseudomonas citronellolis]
MLTLSIALAAAAALYLAIEWRNVREPSLLFWSAGFSTIAVGSTLVLLRMARLAARDPLTALYNRRALEVRAPRLLEEVCSARPGALLLIDIDNFKLVNDLHGHIAGDRLLVMLSEMIRALLPGGALAARLGGDEFVILLGDVTDERVVALGSALREQFHRAAAQAFATPEAVTLSIGASLFDRPPASLAALIEQGDAALYESKRGGRDSIRLVAGGEA